MRLLGTIAGALLLLSPLAIAQPVPDLLPTRDFSAAYGSGSERVAVAWSAVSQILRVDPPSGVFHMLVDHRRNRMLLVLPSQRAVLERPIPASLQALRAPDQARFTRGVRARVGRYACTEWRYDSPTGPGRLCLSASNIMLSAEGPDEEGGRFAARLAALVLAPQDPARFSPPEGYAFLPGAETTLSAR
jgi:hypothetical protein